MKKKIIVEQACFQNIADFHNEPKFRKGLGELGVYIWGFSLEGDYKIPTSIDKFIPYYVGRSLKSGGCMYSRTHEHIANLAGGNLSIFDIGSAVMGNQFNFGEIQDKYKNESKIAKKNKCGGPILPDYKEYPNLLFFPEGVHKMHLFTNNAVIKSQVEWMLKRFCIMYLVPIEPNSNDIENLEKFIGNIVGYEKLITRKYDKPDIHVEVKNNKGNIQLNDYKDLFLNCNIKIPS